MTLGMTRNKEKPTEMVCEGMQLGNNRTKALASALDKMTEYEFPKIIKLSNNNITKIGAVVLINSFKMNLKNIDLSKNNIGRESLKLL